MVEKCFKEVWYMIQIGKFIYMQYKMYKEICVKMSVFNFADLKFTIKEVGVAKFCTELISLARVIINLSMS